MAFFDLHTKEEPDELDSIIEKPEDTPLQPVARKKAYAQKEANTELQPVTPKNKNHFSTANNIKPVRRKKRFAELINTTLLQQNNGKNKKPLSLKQKLVASFTRPWFTKKQRFLILGLLAAVVLIVVLFTVFVFLPSSNPDNNSPSGSPVQSTFGGEISATDADFPAPEGFEGYKDLPAYINAFNRARDGALKMLKEGQERWYDYLTPLQLSQLKEAGEELNNATTISEIDEIQRQIAYIITQGKVAFDQMQSVQAAEAEMQEEINNNANSNASGSISGGMMEDAPAISNVGNNSSDRVTTTTTTTVWDTVIDEDEPLPVETPDDSDSTTNAPATPEDTTPETPEPSEKAVFINEWTARLNNYLAASPLAGTGAIFATAAYEYNIDPRWAAAVAAVETNKGQVCYRPHNAWNWGESSWNNWTDAIYAYTRHLSRAYGHDFTQSVAQKEHPSSWKSWYNKVINQMHRIGG